MDWQMIDPLMPQFVLICRRGAVKEPRDGENRDAFQAAFAAKIPALVKQPHPNPLNIIADSKVMSILIMWNAVDYVDEVIIIREVSIEPFADPRYCLPFSFANPFEERRLDNVYQVVGRLDVLCDLSHPDDRNLGSHNVGKEIELKVLLLAIIDSQKTDEF